MLSLERRKTESVDWAKPLGQFIRNHYDATAERDHQDAIGLVQRLREDVKNAQDKNEGTKDILYQYLGLLECLEKRFPVNETNLRICFNWHESLKGKKTSSFNVYFEKAGILFNIAAVLSQIASLQNRSSPDGLKLACQYLQTAAGTFESLKDVLERHPQPNIFDFLPELLTVMIHLMLAQAQECFYEKAVKDNMKASIIAKLAAQVADYYEFVLTSIANPSISSGIPKTWNAHIQVKIAIYKANSQYRMALAHKEGDQYGLEVARLQVACNLLEEAKKKNVKSVSNELQQLFNAEYSVITAARAAAEKDNDTIYHDTVPPETKLDAIEKKAIVKPTPLPDSVHLTGEKDPFWRLVPFSITEKLSVYQERKDTLIRNEIRQIDEQNQLAIGSLSSMHLPGAIEALETPVGIPKTLQDKVNLMRQEGGVRLISDLVETLEKLAKEDSNLLIEITQKLDKEEKEDNEMRQQYGVAWIRTPSHTLTSQLRQENAKFSQNIEHARKSDAFVLKRFKDHQPFIAKLTGTQEELLSLLPSSSGKSNSDPTVAALKASLTQLDQLIAERSTLRQQLSDISKKDDISGVLLNWQGEAEEAYAQELKKYEAIQVRLQQSYGTQANLLSRIQSENQQFEAAKQSSNTSAQREQVLQQLNTAFKVYSELKGNLGEGIQFYTNFQEILKTFKRKCDDFILARTTEKQELIKDIQDQSNRASAPPSQFLPPQNPGYSQPPPQNPGYSQPPPQNPGYSQPPPQNPVYQQQPPRSPQAQPPTYSPGYQPGYQQAPNAYQPQPPTGYQPQPNFYAQPPPGYQQQPPPGYHQPPPGYHQPPQGYQQQPPPGYPQQPPPGYKPPQGYAVTGFPTDPSKKK